MALWNKEKNYYELFMQITNLKLIDFPKGIRPNEKFRNASNSMKEIFYNEKIDSKKLKRLYDIYGEEIILEYLNDVELKNKSNLKRHGLMLIEDHVKIYSEEELKNILNRFFSKQELQECENYVLLGVLQKFTELIDTYKYSNLVKYPTYVKNEIKLGIFEDIVVKGKKYTNAERKKLVKLSQKWDKDTFNKYQNLELLKKRLMDLPQDEVTLDYINQITQISKMSLEQINSYGETLKEKIRDIYLDYEIKNREHIIDKVYNPKNKKEIVIDDLSKLGNGAMLHFFGPYKKIFSLNNYYTRLEKSLKRKLTADERNMARKKFEVMNNNYIVNKTVPFTVVGQSNEINKYSVDIHNQISCMLITAEDIYNMKGTRGNLALGFSKRTLKPDQIATISNKNINSNKNIENVETTNDFMDFSSTFSELLNKGNNTPNTEVVMFRNTDMTTLEPSYVLYIAYDDINSEHEKENIKIYKEQLKEAGINVPFVIFDQYTIMKKLEKEKSR